MKLEALGLAIAATLVSLAYSLTLLLPHHPA